MGAWSQPAGRIFLDWLEPGNGQRWLDVGCGNGAFTELLAQKCAPAELHGIDPSDAQLAFARSRPGLQRATFHMGDAMSLPFDADRFDAAVMALVIFFVPEPAKGVAEMARVVRPGGVVAAYAWDVQGGGFPYAAIISELQALGISRPMAPNPGASRQDAMRALWSGAGPQAIETRAITVRRDFTGFDDFWAASTALRSQRQVLEGIPPGEIDQLKARVQARLKADASGQIRYEARANAIKGLVPA